MAQEDKDRVREATDLVALVSETVLLQPRGGEFWGCCPFHHEKSPSFHVIPSQQRWKCFGCGKGGDCFQFVMDRDNVDFPDALRTLADRAGIELSQDAYARRRGSGSKRARLFEAVEAAARFYNAQLTRVRGEGPDRARAYLAPSCSTPSSPRTSRARCATSSSTASSYPSATSRGAPSRSAAASSQATARST